MNLLVILLILPAIFITSLHRKTYHYFFPLARFWAKTVLYGSGFQPKVRWDYRPDRNGQYLICPNHTSMADILLTLALFPNEFLFIGKKELSKWPLFGYFYRRTNLLVDRSSLRSRKQVFEKASEIVKEGKGLCIFPEGGAPREEVTLAPFKSGAFRLAVAHQIPIIPVTYLDCKRRFPFSIWRGGPGRLRVVVHPLLEPQENSPEEAARLQSACYRIILQTLQSNKI